MKILKEYCLDVLLPFILGIAVMAGVLVGSIVVMDRFGAGYLFVLFMVLGLVGFSIYWCRTR